MNKKTGIISGIGLAVVIILALLITKGFLHMEKPAGNPEAGRAELIAMAEKDVGAVQAAIQAQEEQVNEALRAQQEAEEAALAAQRQAEAEALAAASEEERQAAFDQWCAEANAMADADQFKGIFSTSVVVGDSLAHGFLQTDLLFESNVVAEVGASLYDLMEKIPQIASLYPSKIFIYAGFNDIGLTFGNFDAYYADYFSFIQLLQAACPGVPIYINHLIPCLNLDTVGNELYGMVDVYNGLIDQLAEACGLTVIDTLDLVKEEFYYKDGYHMIYPFYPLWLRRMAEVSGLM